MNEEDYIGPCIDSVSFSDEIVVIDSFSKDRTVEIAREKGAKVIQRAWPGYRDQKLFGLQSSQHEWVLNIDADEQVSPGLRESILKLLRESHERTLKGEPEPADGYYVNRVVYFLGRWWRRGGWYPEYRLRLVRKSKAGWAGSSTHERPVVEGAKSTLDGELYHYSFENMEEQYMRLNALSSEMAYENFINGRSPSLVSMLFSPILRFVKFYFVKCGFREGTAGLIVALNETCYTYMKYAKLWALVHESRLKKSTREAASEPQAALNHE